MSDVRFFPADEKIVLSAGKSWIHPQSVNPLMFEHSFFTLDGILDDLPLGKGHFF